MLNTIKRGIRKLSGNEALLYRPSQSQWIRVIRQMAPAAPNPYLQDDETEIFSDQTGEQD